jgi:hypothetical protein
MEAGPFEAPASAGDLRTGLALSRDECPKFFGPLLTGESSFSNSLLGRPFGVLQVIPWLSLRKEDGYGDPRFHPTFPIEHRL